MTARLRRLLGALRDAFWLVPALMVVAAIVAPTVLVDVDRSHALFDVLTAVSSCEGRASRRPVVERHADLVVGDAERTVQAPADLDAVRALRRELARRRHPDVGGEHFVPYVLERCGTVIASL